MYNSRNSVAKVQNSTQFTIFNKAQRVLSNTVVIGPVIMLIPGQKASIKVIFFYFALKPTAWTSALMVS